MSQASARELLPRATQEITDIQEHQNGSRTTKKSPDPVFYFLYSNTKTTIPTAIIVINAPRMISNSGIEIPIAMKFLTYLTIVICLLAPASAQDAETLRARYATLQENRADELRTLAQRLAAGGDQVQSEGVLATEEARDPGREYFFVPPTIENTSNVASAVGGEPARDEAAGGTSNGADLLQIQREFAAKLYKLATDAANQGADNLAFAWLNEVCCADPNHAEARRILGYRQIDGQWLQSSSKTTVKTSHTRHPLMPWGGGTFLSVESPNYEIASMASEADTLRLANQLERWRTIWLQAFFDYWAPKSTVERRLTSGSIPTRTGRKHKIVFFGDRDQYVQTMSKLGVTGVEQSTGYYNDRHSTIFFYNDQTPDIETWLQEQCHQLFQEEGSVRKDPVEQSHICILEGLGMFFESLVEYPNRDYCTLGGFDARRLQFAHSLDCARAFGCRSTSSRRSAAKPSSGIRKSPRCTVNRVG